MIKNESQLGKTKYWIALFKTALEQLEQVGEYPGSARPKQLTKEALKGKIKTLEEEVKEYELTSKIDF